MPFFKNNNPGTQYVIWLLKHLFNNFLQFIILFPKFINTSSFETYAFYSNAQNVWQCCQISNINLSFELWKLESNHVVVSNKKGVLYFEPAYCAHWDIDSLPHLTHQCYTPAFMIHTWCASIQSPPVLDTENQSNGSHAHAKNRNN